MDRLLTQQELVKVHGRTIADQYDDIPVCKSMPLVPLTRHTGGYVHEVVRSFAVENRNYLVTFERLASAAFSIASDAMAEML